MKAPPPWCEIHDQPKDSDGNCAACLWEQQTEQADELRRSNTEAKLEEQEES